MSLNLTIACDHNAFHQEYFCCSDPKKNPGVPQDEALLSLQFPIDSEHFWFASLRCIQQPLSGKSVLWYGRFDNSYVSENPYGDPIYYSKAGLIVQAWARRRKSVWMQSVFAFLKTLNEETVVYILWH